MHKLIQQITSFILPVTVLILIPLLIEKEIVIKASAAFIGGVVLMVTGLGLMIMTISGFLYMKSHTYSANLATRTKTTKKMFPGGFPG